MQFTPFEEALRTTCAWFSENIETARKGPRKVTNKAALITGISGQDGSYLAELLVDKGYTVHGIIRRHAQLYLPNLTGIRDRVHLHYGDVQSQGRISQILQELKGFAHIEVYNLAAMSHVKVSFDVPDYVINVDGTGVLNVLEAIKGSGFMHKIRFYQASTSEMFGKVLQVPQTEETPFNPQSPYACAKVYGHWITKNYRESYDMFACSGILFNHESERRGPTFVTQKICNGVKGIANGTMKTIRLGNIKALRDWGYAKDYVYAMWLILQHDTPQDYVVATGEMHSVQEFVEAAFLERDMRITWNKTQTAGYDQHGEKRVHIDTTFFRPREVDELCGEIQKITRELGWEPSTRFKELVKIMMR